MSSRKDKLLESAQKFIAKGQLDRAIKDYEQIVALDSADIRYRQKLAELLVRANRKEEAIGEYDAIGRHYSEHAFYLKAIAVYKQIQKLDPGNIKITLSLASLNEKQGLTGNALAEYNIALSYYQKTRQLPEAIKVLDQMLAADPGNLTTLLKYAETYFTAGVSEKSYEQFARLAALLAKSGDDSAFRQICTRVTSLFPDRKDFLLKVMSGLMEEDSADTAIPYLLAITGKESGNRGAWELLAEAYQRQDDRDKCMATLQRMVTLFPEEPSFREKLGTYTAAAGPREPAEAASPSPVTVSPEESELPEAGAELAPVPDERPVAAEPSTAGHGETWEDIDLSLEDEQNVLEPAPYTDDLPVEGSGETAEEHPPAADVGAGPQAYDYSEIDLELEAEKVAVGTVPHARGDDVDEPYLVDDISEIDLEIDGPDAPLSLDDLLAEEGGAEQSAGIAQPEFATEMPDAGVIPSEEVPGEGGLFDLGAELRLEGLGIADEDAADSGPSGKYTLDGLFSAFKQGVDRQLDQGDTETHYNLGIAYKEMGLYDDAIAEFQAASLGTDRVADCLTLQGICYRDKGDSASAEEAFRKGLAMAGLSTEEALSLKYELALLLENTDRVGDALQLYREVRQVDAGFREVGAKIAVMTGEETRVSEELELLELEVEEEA